jgi:hypothetical protein
MSANLFIFLSVYATVPVYKTEINDHRGSAALTT